MTELNYPDTPKSNVWRNKKESLYMPMPGAGGGEAHDLLRPRRPSPRQQRQVSGARPESTNPLPLKKTCHVYSALHGSGSTAGEPASSAVQHAPGSRSDRTLSPCAVLSELEETDAGSTLSASNFTGPPAVRRPAARSQLGRAPRRRCDPCQRPILVPVPPNCPRGCATASWGTPAIVLLIRAAGTNACTSTK